MRTFFQGITHFYRNLRLQTKLTITHLVIVTIPMVAIPVLFFTQLYDMIVADTVRKEQEAAIQTAPMIEETVADILAVHGTLTEHEFYSKLINPARVEDLEVFADSEGRRADQGHPPLYGYSGRWGDFLGQCPEPFGRTYGPDTQDLLVRDFRGGAVHQQVVLPVLLSGDLREEYLWGYGVYYQREDAL